MPSVEPSAQVKWWEKGSATSMQMETSWKAQERLVSLALRWVQEQLMRELEWVATATARALPCEEWTEWEQHWREPWERR